MVDGDDGGRDTGTDRDGPRAASLWVRTPAFLVDQAVVVIAVVGPVLASGVTLEALLSPGGTRTATFLALNGAAFVYHLLLEWQTGGTVGKWLFGLRVVSDDGSRLGFSGSFVRNALRAVDGLGYWSVAVAVILYRGDGKRIGDVLGRTLVVRTG